ncbi:DUF4210 domain-containing protein [Caenorhabditis elegans]|uniref:DUF4210 domain-containing protein n=1 Tax=Caenorhabditis elegans TaxID=6239 RepID=Q94049_CAEEL|nr:DUF4210 domain-containing protein [Caenorhabditis elegans]CAB03357.1 DUF4210 domain-containing protein [Caenorhabditis elegans]|eukprot:NP_501745.1 Uncharacterized protein CELE_T13F2.6 [Caenorhabditis elegans]
MNHLNENTQYTNKSDIVSAEILVLDLILKGSTSYKYVVCHQKNLFESTIPLVSLKEFGRNGLQFGTVLNGSFSFDSSKKQIHVKSVKCIYMLPKATPGNKWAQLKLEFDEKLKRNVLACSALTTGCLTYLDKDYTSPSIFNDMLGLIADCELQPKLPKREIGRLLCTVIAVQCPTEKIWKFRIETVKKFDKIVSLAMSANVSVDEHFGLVTREECEEKRDLRLVSSRDFPRDVRIFRSGSHCCESIESGHRRPHHHQSKCMNTCVGEVRLIGKCMAFRMKRCHGMNATQPVPLDSLLSPVIPSASSTTIKSANYSPFIPTTTTGGHVDYGSMRNNVSQLQVNVQSGFVEVVTIAEYSGYTDHDGRPLLWSHDVEFVVDISGMFHDQNLSLGLYEIKVVRFHRSNVFAKWRLARKNPILKAMRTRFHSQSAHSINLATMGVSDISLNEDGICEQEQRPRRRLLSFSRFGSSAQSCCLPRTDSLDKVGLYDALVRNEKTSISSTTSSATVKTFPKANTPLGTKRLNYSRSVSMSNKPIELDDDLMWRHHDTSVLKIVEDEDESVLPKLSLSVDYDENSNVF